MRCERLPDSLPARQRRLAAAECRYRTAAHLHRRRTGNRGRTERHPPGYLISGTAQDCTVALDSNLGCVQIRAASNSSGGPAADDGQWHIFAAILTPLGNATLIDGYLVASSTTQTHGANTLRGLALGSNGGGTAPWVGDIAEAMVFNSALTFEQVALITTALGEKW